MTDEPETIDPITFARFMVLPGAVSLLNAFSRIPPGRLRQSAIDHVAAMADHYDQAPDQTRGPDPLAVAAQALAAPSPPALALIAPGFPVEADTKEQTVIAKRMAGEWPIDIAEDLGLPHPEVTSIINRFRGALGKPLPPLGAKRTVDAAFEFPAPEPEPEPVKAPRASPKKKGRRKGKFPLTVEDIAPDQFRFFVAAAKRRDMPLETFMALRRRVIELAREGKLPIEIEPLIGEPRHFVNHVLAEARAARVELPDMPLGGAARKRLHGPEFWKPGKTFAAAQAASQPPPPRPSPNLKTFPLDADGLNGGARAAIEKAAAKHGTDLTGWMQVRRAALDMFRAGHTAQAVADVLKVDIGTATTWRYGIINAGLLDTPQKATA